MQSMFDLEKNASMEHCLPGICEDVTMSGDFMELLAMTTGCLGTGRRDCWLTVVLGGFSLGSGADDSVSNGSFMHTCE